MLCLLRCAAPRFMSEFTGLPVERVEEECDRENFLSPAQVRALLSLFLFLSALLSRPLPATPCPPA